MESTLENGDDIIVEKFSYLTNNPERYDIIVFRESESVNYIKRVIALPGETIQITEGKIYINERAIFDAYGNAKIGNDQCDHNSNHNADAKRNQIFLYIWFGFFFFRIRF